MIVEPSIFFSSFQNMHNTTVDVEALKLHILANIHEASWSHRVKGIVIHALNGDMVHVSPISSTRNVSSQRGFLVLEIRA